MSTGRQEARRLTAIGGRRGGRGEAAKDDASSAGRPPQPAPPPHAPESGWLRRALGPLYVTGVFWFRIHRWGARHLPEWAVGPAMVLFTSFFFVVLRNIRRALAANLEAVLGPCGWRERQRRIWRTLWVFSWCLTERYESLATDHPFTLSNEGMEIWRQVSAGESGAILVTAHLGAWEVGSRVPASVEGKLVHLVREGETDPKAQEFIAEMLRSRVEGRYTTHFAGDPHLGMELLDALRRGEVVALQGDRPRSGGRTVEVSLFGRPFALPLGPAALARAAGVPLVPVFFYRDSRRSYRCVFRPPIEVAPDGAVKGSGPEAALLTFAADLEAAIRRAPHQWFVFARLWR